MIYVSLKPVRQWHHPLVLPGYLVFALFSGALCLAAVAAFWPGRHVAPAAIGLLAGLGAIAQKLGYWRAIDAPPPSGTPTIETATGLGRIGPTRPLDPPHTEENYLMREMGYRIARKHARTLRLIVVAGGFALPALLALLFLALAPAAPVPAAILIVAAALLVLAGLFLERWLFFAEATHTVMLYYRRAA
jgi:DMSO reductase anchor subunit